MKNEPIPSIKIRVQYELAYEIIHYSLIFIALGFAYVFASNLLRFNWFTVFFIILALLFLYLKKESFIIINKDTFTLTYWKIYTAKEIQMDKIEKFTFYADKRLLEIRVKNNEVVTCYLKKKQKETILSYLILYYPNIPCIVID